MRFLLTMLFLTAMTVGAQAPHKNLKVLKDDQVRPVMGAMNAALGQRKLHRDMGASHNRSCKA